VHLNIRNLLVRIRGLAGVVGFFDFFSHFLLIPTRCASNAPSSIDYFDLIDFAGTPATVSPGATSSRTTDPAPVLANFPTVTGAINIVLEPISAPSAITVGCFSLPS